MSGKRLVVSGDDLGLLPGIDQGLREAAEQGVLTSVSLLANGPNFNEAVSFCRRHPELGLGAHLALVEGRALISRDQGGLGQGARCLLPVSFVGLVAQW